MPSYTRRGACGTTVCVGGFVLRYAVCFVRAGVARRILLLLSDCFVRVLCVGSLQGACVGLCV